MTAKPMTITEATQEQGRLMSITWNQKDFDIKLEHEGKAFKNITANIDTAGEMISHLGYYIRVYGAGTYTRHAFEGWVMDSFEVANFVQLHEDSLKDVIEEIRGLNS